jgi:Protein of unknown function (DUF1488)
MPISFRPNRGVYDPAVGVMWFFATDGPLLVRCGVLKEALATIDQGCRENPEMLERIYQRHRERIQGVAARKHRAREFDKPGVILVRSLDLANK